MNRLRTCLDRPLAGFLAALVVLLQARAASALPWQGLVEELKKVEAGAEGRLRYEWWSGLEAAPAGDPDYDFFSLRVRPYARYPGERFTFFFQFQYAGGFDLPQEAVSGPGAAYFGASTPKEDPQATDVLELYMQARDLLLKGLGFRVGRQAIQEGLEVVYDDPAFNWLKKARLSERLVGIWEWPNVGRRFDAADVFFGTTDLHLDVYAAKVLAGGVEYGEAMSPLDDLDLLGGSVTLKRGAVLKATEFRLFEIYCRDDRTSAEQVAGGAIELHSAGGSLAGIYPGPGPGQLDLLLWGCYQWGDWGRQDHRAYAVVAETGYQMKDLWSKPWLRAGLAHASGDGDPARGEHKSFFNLVPTNHKYYGYLDTTALSNLVNAYFQLLLRPADKLVLQADGHLFWLDEGADSWYAGSGAVTDRIFGFAGGYDASKGTSARLTGGKRFVGSELDLTATCNAYEYVEFQAGYSHFFGAEGAERAFPAQKSADWFFLQTSVRF
ncbi:MAG: alginate export family protein [bacterium]